MALAKKIGTYDLSLEPYKDCCALIARHPKTRSRPEKLQELEARMFPDYEMLIEQTLAEAICLEAVPRADPPAEPDPPAGKFETVRQ